jgi:hypothetical protein
MAGILGEITIDYILWLVAHGAEKEPVRVHTKALSELLMVSQQTVSRWNINLPGLFDKLWAMACGI